MQKRLNAWRISKYNPRYRDECGRYLKDEWTSYHDIGKVYEGKILTIAEYKEMEERYIETIIDIIERTGAQALQIKNVEKYRSMEEILNGRKIVEKEWVEGDYLKEILRQCLRENMWCSLENDMISVQVGYDYYVHVYTLLEFQEMAKLVQKRGLFIEKYYRD